MSLRGLYLEGLINGGAYFRNFTVLLQLQWHTRIYDKTFHVNCNGSSNKAKYLKFFGRKVESTRNSNFGDYPGDIRL